MEYSVVCPSMKMRFLGAPRGRGVSIELETGRPRPASSPESDRGPDKAGPSSIFIRGGELEKIMGALMKMQESRWPPGV